MHHLARRADEPLDAITQAAVDISDALVFLPGTVSNWTSVKYSSWMQRDTQQLPKYATLMSVGKELLHFFVGIAASIFTYTSPLHTAVYLLIANIAAVVFMILVAI